MRSLGPVAPGGLTGPPATPKFASSLGFALPSVPRKNHVEEVIPRGRTGSEIGGEVTLIDAVEEDITVRAIPPIATGATPLELMP
jgi:hypothetical protein